MIKKTGKFNQEGEVVEVKGGYARNYLIPGGFALAATAGNLKRFKEIEKTREKIAVREKSAFLTIKEKIESISLTIATEAKDNEELYGAINETQILRLLKTEGVDLEKGVLVVEEPIKKIGVYNLKVKLHPQIEAALRVWVVKK